MGLETSRHTWPTYVYAKRVTCHMGLSWTTLAVKGDILSQVHTHPALLKIPAASELGRVPINHAKKEKHICLIRNMHECISYLTTSIHIL